MKNKWNENDGSEDKNVSKVVCKVAGCRKGLQSTPIPLDRLMSPRVASSTLDVKGGKTTCKDEAERKCCLPKDPKEGGRDEGRRGSTKRIQEERGEVNR